MTPRRPRAIIIGFEAMDPEVAIAAMAAGRLPHLERLRREGLTAAMGNPVGMLTGPVWPTIATGTHPDRHGQLNWRVLRAGTYRKEWLGPYDHPACPPFWERLADQGVSSLVSSVPSLALTEHPLVTHVIDWLTHDRERPIRSCPPQVAEAIIDRYGPLEEDRCDHLGAAGDHATLIARLHRDTGTFADGIRWLMDHHPSDVVVAVSGASHCAGHQLWDHHRASPSDNPMLDAYAELDRELGRILEGASPDAIVVAILSHGMGGNAVMPHLADLIVRGIDDAMGPPGRVHRARELLRRTPNRVARLALRSARRPFHQLAHIADGSRRFLPVDNFPSHAALRLNIIGREPNGRVHQHEVKALIDQLEAQLLAVVDVDTGAPVVRRVIRLADHFEHIDTSGMGDVIVEWQDAKVVERVASPTIGVIERPFPETRAGAHRQDGLFIVKAPGVPAGAETVASSVDLWPTVAHLLGVDPGDVDGEPLSPLVPSAG